MGTVLLLATEASGEGGFGLNFDILETNLINLVIIIAVLFYFGVRIVGKILTERRSRRSKRPFKKQKNAKKMQQQL